MYLFQCKDKSGAQAKIRVSSVDWALPGAVAFECTHDELACRLLTRCRSDSSGYFNLLAGCKPLQVEQWLEASEANRSRMARVEQAWTKVALPVAVPCVELLLQVRGCGLANPRFCVPKS